MEEEDDRKERRKGGFVTCTPRLSAAAEVQKINKQLEINEEKIRPLNKLIEWK